METILDEKNCKVLLNEELQYIEIRVMNTMPLPDYQFAYEHALLFAGRYGISRLVVHELPEVHKGLRARAWLYSSFLPRMLAKLGLDAKIAVVKPKSRLAMLGGKLAELALDTVNKDFRVEFFDEEQAAVSWITSTVPSISGN